MNTKILGLTAVAAIAASNLGYADTIDFSGVQGQQVSPLVLPEATITNTAGGYVLVGAGAAGQADGFCFLVPNQFNCAQDGELVFSSAVNSLSFDVDGWQSGDLVAISAFNGATLLGFLNAIADGNLNFSGFGDITRLVFDDSSTAAGVGYSTFLFNSVPEPGTLALLGLGLAGLGLSRRRRVV